MVLTLSLSLSFGILFVVTAAILVRKYLQQSRNSHGVWRKGEGTTTEMLTPIVSETFSRDNRLLYSGRQHAFRVPASHMDFSWRTLYYHIFGTTISLTSAVHEIFYS